MKIHRLLAGVLAVGDASVVGFIAFHSVQIAEAAPDVDDPSDDEPDGGTDAVPCLLSTSCASNQCFATASFRFHLAMDTLAGRCDVPPIGSSRDLHPFVVRPAGRT